MPPEFETMPAAASPAPAPGTAGAAPAASHADHAAHDHDHDHHHDHHHGAETPEPTATTPEQWASIDEYMSTPEFRAMMHREFPEDFTEWTDPVTRRQFISLMGASLALAGVVGCSPKPVSNRKIVPYVNQPDQITPGVPLYFATAHVLNGVAAGVVVKSVEGRPVKVEGNTLHPSSLGGADVFALGSILNLYDPDRSRQLTRNGIAALWEDALKAIRTELAKQKPKKGAGVRILTETVTSPTFHKQVEALKALYPEVKWVQFDAVSRDTVRQATKQAFGKVLNPVYDFTKADVVLSIDSDFTNEGVGSLRYARDFASRRKVRENKQEGNPAELMNRLYVVESMPSCTGSVADHRLAMRQSDMETFLRTLAQELKVAGAPAPATQLSGSAKEWIKPLAKDLQEKAGKSLVVVGDTQPPAVHALAYAINAALKNVNATVSFTAPLDGGTADQLSDLKGLVDEMNAGKVELLFILESNPVYSAPRDLKFLEALKKVPTRVHLGQYEDETARWSTWHIPSTHFLESWGDALGHDGTATIMQPLIAPLYQGRSPLELMNEIIDGGDTKNEALPKTVTPYEIVRRTWQDRLKNASGGFEEAWQRAIRDGVVANTALEKQQVTLAGNWSEGASNAAAPTKGVEIVFRADPTIYDGRFANNGWLQELPKPVSKICWDNVIFMSRKTAEAAGISAPRVSWMGGGEHGRAKVDVVEIEYQGKKLKGPIWILPGHADGTITVHLGFGREAAGNVAMGGVYERIDANKVGFDAYTLRQSKALHFDVGAELKRVAGEEFIVACTQMHFSMEGRKPVRYATREDYLKQKDFAKVPPAAAGETGPINALLPGPHQPKANGRVVEEDRHGKGGTHDDHGHKHDDKHDDHEHKHDSRTVPLTILPPEPPSGKSARRWAMAIDLTACNGCSACMVACQSENNTPVVGKEQVTRGREMHWIRIDRYYQGAPEDPDNLVTLFQPVPCQQCEKAPCEIVCPVAATVHSADGLNDMVYNRCVGTRYCANNCPYKVRRFNFLTYADYATDTLKLARNPDVSVRTRGVMEKCTYCVQRIRAAEIEAEREWHRDARPKDANGRPRILDGDIVTACQAACPSGAIVFGDLADPNSRVNRWKSEQTNYGLLAELNTMPRTTYLATIRNPNKELAERLKKSQKGA